MSYTLLVRRLRVAEALGACAIASSDAIGFGLRRTAVSAEARSTQALA